MEELAGVSVDDPDVEVVDEQGEPGSGQVAADADVAQAAVVSQGDGEAPQVLCRSYTGPRRRCG